MASSHSFKIFLAVLTLMLYAAGRASSASPAGESNVVTLCEGVTADAGGLEPAGAALQTCIDRTEADGVLEIPVGLYRMDRQVKIRKAITLRTAGTANIDGNCETPEVNCAALQAAPDLFEVAGFLRGCDEDPSTRACREMARVKLDHLILDGNRAARLSSAAANQCAAGSNGFGFNASIHNCRACEVSYSVSKNALCGTGLEYSGHSANIRNNVFRDNGENAVRNMWSDGLTIHWSDSAVVMSNLFMDNSDIDFISGGGREAIYNGNTIAHERQLAFGGLMLDNFNGSTPGDFSGAVVSQNIVDCGDQNCHFGMNLGPHAWYLSRNIIGGTVTDNLVVNARQGINVDGAGTAENPLHLYGNDVYGSPASAIFLCGRRATSDININTGDSQVDRADDQSPITTMVWHGCP
ncbi:MAG: hypothetical protein HYR55_19935 [Acidobacteria bacterium]|nr:hypothetical protein [Acidobacteriota bacterium]MBI3658647.1 hypothetical protein [Acidobacteriota bacterium]